MTSEGDPPGDPRISDATLLLLNRATLVVHSVRGAVHELNNILQMISGSAEMLASSGIPSAATTRVDGIIKQTGRGHAILQAVGDLARADRVSLQAIDVTAIASRALELRHYEHKRSSINTVLERGDGGPKRVRMDAQQLLQAILNLIVNAEQAVGRLADRRHSSLGGGRRSARRQSASQTTGLASHRISTLLRHS